jgi:soluble lytic murein transglycosylase-like protein
MCRHVGALSGVVWAAGFVAALTPGAVHAGTAAGAVQCVGADGRSHLLRERPAAAYSYFHSCTAAATVTTASRGTADPARLAPPSAPANTRLPARRAPPRSGAAPGATPHADLVSRAATRYGLDANYLTAIMHVESGFNSSAVSSAGATGLMQIMPATARRFGADDPQLQLRDPAINVDIGARYLHHLRGLFNDDWYLITAAYNAGEGAVRKYGNRIPPYKETQTYVERVERRFEQYRLANLSR